jgi:FKBP-type peptidyl-prolyl cis-trans isomerase
MQLNRFFILSFFSAVTFISCNNDDDGGRPEIVERDREEQAMTDADSINNFLDTHFYNYEEFEDPSEDFDYMVRFDSITGDNSDKTPLSEEENLIKKTITYEEVDYDMYVLKVREGEGMQPKFSDSTLVSYRGDLLDLSSFDNVATPVWFDLATLVKGFTEGVIEFKGASDYTVNADNTVSFTDDYGIGAFIFPSGIGYFSSGQPGIPAYSPLIFNVNLFRVNEADHDKDGIPSWMEDLNENKNLLDDDTDGDDTPNFADPDDDGDGTPTKEEIEINEDGSLEFPDSNGNGTPDYLDPDTFQ